MAKFGVGEIVAYKKGELIELGEVKEIIDYGDDGGGYRYRVLYHMGDTSAVTFEKDLIGILNLYAFSIVRKRVEEETETEVKK